MPPSSSAGKNGPSRWIAGLAHSDRPPITRIDIEAKRNAHAQVQRKPGRDSRPRVSHQLNPAPATFALLGHTPRVAPRRCRASGSGLQAVEFILENWSSRETSQVALKFGLLLLPIALWRWVPAIRRRPGSLLVSLSAATGVLKLVVAYVQIVRGEYTATLLAWKDGHFAVETAGYQLSFALVAAWCGLRRRTQPLHGVTYALVLCVGLAGLGNLLGWGGRFPLVAQHGTWALGLGVALLTGAALGRIAWLRAQLAIVGLAYAYFASVHLHAWLVRGELAMGHLGPSLWHDLALPAVVLWALRRS